MVAKGDICVHIVCLREGGHEKIRGTTVVMDIAPLRLSVTANVNRADYEAPRFDDRLDATGRAGFPLSAFCSVLYRSL